MLGRATAAVEMSRGGREGNNALLKYGRNRSSLNQDINLFLEKDVSFQTLEYLTGIKHDPYNSFVRFLFANSSNYFQFICV